MCCTSTQYCINRSCGQWPSRVNELKAIRGTLFESLCTNTYQVKVVDGEPKKRQSQSKPVTVVVCGSLQDCRSNHLFCRGMCKGLDLGWLIIDCGWCL